MQIENSDSIQVCGSSLSGYITSTYDELVAAFGEPTFTDIDPREKVQCEWVLRIGDVVATIYNWKTGVVPLDVYEWHIGGFDRGEVDAVRRAIAEHRG